MDLSYSNTSNNDANIFLSFAFALYVQWTKETYFGCENLFVFKYI